MHPLNRAEIVTIAGLAATAVAAGTIAIAQQTIKKGASGQTATRASGNAELAAPLRSLLVERQWMNTRPLAVADIRGKVVLVNFWTYSCINSLRTLPYLRAWAERYRDRGLVVVGVHAPEFAFEHDSGNVRSALALLNLGYPIVLDNGFDIWRGFGNKAWPGFYLVDAKGQVRHRAFGEGDYEVSERLIQRLLTEADGHAATNDVGEIVGVGAQAAPDWDNIRSPETYIGYAQAHNFASDGGMRRDKSFVYRAESTPLTNQWSLSGTWTVGSEFAAADRTSGAIAFRFHARDLHLVLAPPGDGHSVRFRLTIDGKPPGSDHGADTDPNGWGTVKEPRMYQLVRQSGQISDRNFRIEFLSAGVRAYAFTFG